MPADHRDPSSLLDLPCKPGGEFGIDRRGVDREQIRLAIEGRGDVGNDNGGTTRLQRGNEEFEFLLRKADERQCDILRGRRP